MMLITLPLDQWTKDYSRQNYLTHEDSLDTTIYQGRREELIAVSMSGAWFTGQMTYVRNHGASWGVFRDIGQGIRLPWLLLSGALTAAGLLWTAVRLFKRGDQKAALSVAALIAGGIGNFIDRLRLGYVVDFLSFRCGWGAKTWVLPCFNVADIIIVLSLCFAIYTLLFENHHTAVKTVT